MAIVGGNKFVKGFVDAWEIDAMEAKDVCVVIIIQGTLAF
jgi:hypothetical protein